MHDSETLNVGPEDLHNGNLKLILGLIWTLIRRYQIRSTGRALSTKDALLAWVNTQIPDQNIKNFTTDWNSGVAICALVERVRPGLITHYASLNRSDKLKNCSLGMGLAEDKLDIPKILEPEDMCHSDVDEISVMTYISYFCNPANAHLLKWVQAVLPQRGINNFTTDWNNGVNLGYLLEALNPGGFAECSRLDPKNALDNLTKCMKAADNQLGIKPVLTPAQMADPSVDELNIVTYLSRFQNAKPLPQPQAVSCSGEGLRKALIGKESMFEVDISKGGSGELLVEITCSGKPVKATITPSLSKKTLILVKYTPESAGKISIAIKWSGTEIPTSPYSVSVVDPRAVSLSGPQVSGKECARVGQLVSMEVKGVHDPADLDVSVEFSNGHTEQAKLSFGAKGSSVIACSYTPRVVGTDKVVVKVSGMSVSGSPFKVNVVDPTLYRVALKEASSDKPILLNSKVAFAITSSKGSVEGVTAKLTSPSGSRDITLSSERDGSFVGIATPTAVGTHEISVACGKDNLKGSPITFQVSDPSKCSFLDALPKFLHVGEGPRSVMLSVQGAGEGSASGTSSDTKVLGVECRKARTGYEVVFEAKKVGEATVGVEWNGGAVSGTPHKVSVCDASKCSATGAGLTSGKGKIKQTFEFMVQTNGAGKGELSVNAKGPKSTTYPAEVVKVREGTYKVTFTTFEVGKHTIAVLWSEKNIPNSPFTIHFTKAAEASSFTVTGDGMSTAIARDTGKFVIVGPESGLLSSEILKISLSGSGIQSSMVPKSGFNTKSGKALIFASDNGNGSYAIEYTIPQAGNFSLSVTSDGDHIPGSPFQLKVRPAPDASKCKIFGHVIDNPSGLVVERALEFKVDTTDAGVGELTVTAKDPKGATIPVFIAKDMSNTAREVHSVKIDPKVQGKYEVSMMWSGKHVSKSPFTFQLCDPKAVVIQDLPDPTGYVARKGEAITFLVDGRKAGMGELKAAAKLEGGQLVNFIQKKNKDGTILLSYTPEKEGRFELILTYGGVSILSTQWIVDIADLSTFKVIPPQGPTKVNEDIRFVINGLSKKQSKNISISAKNKTHDAAVKLEFSDKGVSTARFTAKNVGEYIVEVKMASKHVAGSPFTSVVVNPASCVIQGSVPTILSAGTTHEFTVNTAGAGPGELTFEGTSESGGVSPVEVVITSVKGGKKVKMVGKGCGKGSFCLKFGGHLIPSMPVEVIATDPTKCHFISKVFESGSIKTNESITFTIDTTSGGCCPPEVIASGPKSKYDIKLVKVMEGQYSVTFTPWQDGTNTLRILIGGVDVTGSPIKFKVQKPLDASKVTVGGTGLKEAIANRRTEITIYARESMLVEKGILNVSFDDGKKHGLEVHDQQNGTYNVSFVPMASGNLKLNILGEGKPIAGSPFNISVKPESDPSKCRIQSQSGEDVFVGSSSIYHARSTPFELRVITTQAGSGQLTAEGTGPNNSKIRVFTTTEKIDGEKVSCIKFDPTSAGVYKISVKLDGRELVGSPYSVRVVDSAKCTLAGSFPSSVRIGEEVSWEINTNKAGEGEVEVFAKGQEVMATVAKKDAHTYVAKVTGNKLGSTSVDVRFGGFPLKGSPYAITVCNPSRCTTNFQSISGGTFNLNIPFKFNVQTEGAGRAKLKVESNLKGTSIVRNPKGSTWEVSFTPKEVGTYILRIFWGEWEIGEPFTFTTCDPGKVKVIGLPNPNEMLLMGEPVAFSVDTSEAGPGELVCRTLSGDGKAGPPVEREETDGPGDVVSLQFQPDSAGKIQVMLQYNGVDILLRPHIYDVPDPSKFKVTPPKGYGQVKEHIKFGVTGVKEDTELSITATHPDHKAKVKTERGTDGNTVFAHFSPKKIGVYAIEVKHAGRHIDGSPFSAQVCDPDACRFMGKIPSIIHVGVEPDIKVDTSEAGPGELTFETEVVSGAEDATTSTEDSTKWVLSMNEGVKKVRIYARWAGYNIPGSPFILTIVESQRVAWSCEALDSRAFVNQGNKVKILLDGSEAGETVPEVVAKGPQEEYSAKIADHEDGTYTVILTPWQIGINEVTILWGGKPIPDMPISFEVVKGIEAKAITASGEGLKGVIAGRETIVMINALEEGLLKRNLLQVALEAEQDEEETDEGVMVIPSWDVSDQGNGFYKITFTIIHAGLYLLSTKYEGEHISGSPFSFAVSAAPDAHMCQLLGQALESNIFAIDHPVKLSVDCSQAGTASLSVSAKQPDGSPIKVYTMEEGDIHHLKLDPVVIGRYMLHILWGGTDIPKSPFEFDVVDPGRCIVEGLSSALLDKHVEFSVLTSGAGDACVPEVIVSTKGSEEESVIEPSEVENGRFEYAFSLEEVSDSDKVTVSIRVAGVHVANSPYSLSFLDSSKFSLVGTNLKENGYAIVCEPVVLEIRGRFEEEEDEEEGLMVTAHGPSADLTVETTQKGEGYYEASFVPVEPGSYELFIEYAMKHVTGSPCSIKVADPSKCQLLGGALTALQVGETGEVTVKTRGAGEGELQAFVRRHQDDPHTSTSPIMECEVVDHGLDTYTINLTGKKIGRSIVDVKWAGFTIPGCPFTTNVCNASKCVARGEVLDSKKGKAGVAINFQVKTKGAGEGKLEVMATGPTAQYTVNVGNVKDSLYNVNFTPWEIGAHEIEVLWGGGHVPGSPFLVDVGNPMELAVCNATGEGLNHAIAGQKAVFVIICSDIGLLDRDVLKVTVMGVTAHAKVEIRDNNNGTYTVSYVAPMAGAYVATVLFHDQHIPGSPFKITVDSGPDSSKCRAYGPALHPNTMAIAGTPLEFFVDTSEAGYGRLKVYVQGPNDYRPKVFMADDEKGVYSIKFDAMKPGRYHAVVAWGENHIPNSPFRIRVHPAADARKVKAYGPGLIDGFMGAPGQFTIDTKNAGIGTLLIRIHGLKDSFKIEAKPLSEGDTRTLMVTYNPTLMGEYTIFVRWSGVHIPGSPCTVHIKQKPGM